MIGGIIVNIKKAEAYKNLVLDMQSRYPIYKGVPSGAEVDLWAPSYNGEIFCQEINTYTYRQGIDYAKKTPHIKYLLVATAANFPNEDDLQMIKKLNTGDREFPYNIYIHKNHRMYQNLTTLFKILGYDIENYRYEELFFTNFCLGYCTSGKPDEKEMMRDADSFRKLCDIIEPENILCLGQKTFNCVYKTLTDFDSIDYGKYIDFVGNHEDVVVHCGDVKTKVYPLVSCGWPGASSRNFELQKQDWKRIAAETK